MESTTIYLIKINRASTAHASHYSAYRLDHSSGAPLLDMLWPSDQVGFSKHNNYEAAAKAMGFAKQERNGNMPRFFFKAKGYNLSHVHDAADTVLNQYCPAAGMTGSVDVYYLDGNQPWRIKGRIIKEKEVSNA